MSAETFLNGRVALHVGDCRDVLREMAAGSVNCVVTSPPYFWLRDYGVDGQMGLEPTPDDYVAGMVAVFREARRVLADDGTFWLNLGDSYSAHAGQRKVTDRAGIKQQSNVASSNAPSRSVEGLGAKNLIGIPWRVAFALQADGWYLRQEVIWHKPNAMPESVKDRCTRAHETVFMLSKRPRYFYDADAIRVPPSPALLKQVAEGYDGADRKDYAEAGAQSASGTKARIIAGARDKIEKQRGHSRRHASFNDRWDQLTREEQMALGSNRRSVWTIGTQPFSEAHFATMAPELAETCILAGCPKGGTVLDPFGGAGTTALVALRHGRSAALIELNPEYAAIARRRIEAEWRVPQKPAAFDAGPLFGGVAA